MASRALVAVKVALGSIHDTGSPGFNARVRMCKLLRAQPAYVAWRAFTTTLFVVPTRQAGGIDTFESIPGLLNFSKFTNSGSGTGTPGIGSSKVRWM